ncbi:class I SAM-dependent methyltransferase [Aestuariirhabdus litorea]|uniref:Class I SAM-dependent methyltransferase n=1 Tax=Aestuariirhabdus litorea TaxID=2528527 RepID=A0A3P3VS82_9GAMM|nr:class I SAM-dependent methyltransferase [Aestuariirhabdus litorea]RRJ85304.1 class I SAM-dependent methyltransferase [Aestuariirhabdus litorea]RWW98526.1 methyltransferase domain-containing protein [Endozoicomonadaceae bacterium GTF-13]
MDADVYEQMARLESKHWWFRGRRAIVADLIRRLGLGPELRILEVGAGTGGNSAMLKAFGSVDSVEPDARARQLAAEVHGVELLAGSLPDALPESDVPYDLIVLMDVLEHVEPHRAALSRLLERLAPGGRLLLTVPALQALWSAHDERHHHHRRYQAGELRRLLEESGFRVERVKYFNSLLLPLIALARLGSRLGLLRGADDQMPGPWLNTLLFRVFAWERHCIGRGLGFPVGVSLLALASRAGDPGGGR